MSAIPTLSSRLETVNEVATDQPLKVKMQVRGKKDVFLAAQPIFSGSNAELMQELIVLRAAGGAKLVTTPNVDQTLNLETTDSFRTAYAAASLRLLDGMPLVMLARLLGAGAAARHTGADLLPDVVAEAAAHDWTVIIAGGSDDCSVRAAERLRAAHPGARVTGLPFPVVSDVADVRSLDFIAELTQHRPDFVFLCLGSPKQEEWFLQWRRELPAGVYIGAGAAVDFAAGDSVRAPVWMRELCLEWVWRLAHEPRRLAGRYLVKGPRFLRVLARSVLLTLIPGAQPAVPPARPVLIDTPVGDLASPKAA